jgi:hypothetical protein
MSEQQSARELFVEYDLDNDGYLDHEEVQHAFRKHFGKVSIVLCLLCYVLHRCSCYVVFMVHMLHFVTIKCHVFAFKVDFVGERYSLHSISSGDARGCVARDIEINGF